MPRLGKLKKRCRGKIRRVAASGSVAGALQRLGQERCSVPVRDVRVAEAGSGAMQRPGALQKRCRGSNRSVASSGNVAGAPRGPRSVAGVVAGGRIRPRSWEGSREAKWQRALGSETLL